MKSHIPSVPEMCCKEPVVSSNRNESVAAATARADLSLFLPILIIKKFKTFVWDF